LLVGSELKLQELYIAKNFRKRGNGTLLLHHAESLAKQQSCGSIFLYVNRCNARAIRLYQSMGYEIANQQIFDIGQGYVMDDYRMVKNIA
jgi:ribosomal protein S18 acetylase RimI-like enzyme